MAKEDSNYISVSSDFYIFQFSLYIDFSVENGRYKSTSTVLIKEKEGEKYFNPIETQFQARFEKLIIRFDDLFEGNKILG